MWNALQELGVRLLHVAVRVIRSGYGATMLSVPLGTFIVVMGLVVGLIGSLYAEDVLPTVDPVFKWLGGLFAKIADWYPRSWSLGAVTFWTVFILFALLLMARRNAVARESARLQARFTDGLDTLHEALETFPPRYFLMKFEDSYVNCELVTREALELIRGNMTDSEGVEQDLGLLEQTIRTVIDNMIVLAQMWDNPDPRSESVYRGNIMCFVSSESVPADQRDSIWEAAKRFCVAINCNSAFESADGFLVVNKELTTTTETRGPTVDDSIKPFALPVTFPGSDEKRPQNLPGAPKAFASNKAEWIQDSHKIASMCENTESFDAGTVQRIRAYYDQDHKGRSIISIPIPSRQGNETNLEVRGVVNIYRNREHILKNDRRAYMFGAIMKPFIFLLSDLLESYDKARGRILEMQEQNRNGEASK